MSLNILKLADSEYQKDQFYEPIINQIKDHYVVIKNTDKTSAFRYITTDDDLIEFMIRDCNITDYTYYTFGLNGVVEASKKGLDIIYFIKCNNGLYYWKYDEKDIMLNYDWKGDNNLCYRFSVRNDKFQSFVCNNHHGKSNEIIDVLNEIINENN
jgi:hypothetical protein